MAKKTNAEEPGFIAPTEDVDAFGPLDPEQNTLVKNLRRALKRNGEPTLLDRMSLSARKEVVEGTTLVTDSIRFQSMNSGKFLISNPAMWARGNWYVITNELRSISK